MRFINVYCFFVFFGFNLCFLFFVLDLVSLRWMTDDIPSFVSDVIPNRLDDDGAAGLVSPQSVATTVVVEEATSQLPEVDETLQNGQPLTTVSVPPNRFSRLYRKLGEKYVKLRKANRRLKKELERANKANRRLKLLLTSTEQSKL